MGLDIASTRIDRTAVLKCSGRIVAGSESAALQEHIRKLQPEYNQFVLHLGDVQFIDSTGLGLIVRLLCSVRSRRGDLKLCAVPENIHSVLQLTKLSSMFDMHATEPAALAAFHQQAPIGTHNAERSSPILCVETSSDLLAYLREVLRRRGYEPLTTTNVSDALVLLKSAKPHLAILGPGILASRTAPLESLRDAAADIPLIEVDAEFGKREPLEAADEIFALVQAALNRVRSARA
jgi:anti-sigma B factor antagonist